MTIKVTMLFQQLTAASTPSSPFHRIAGWSESWYFPGSNLQAAITAVTGGGGLVGQLLGGGLAGTRASMLALGAAIVGARFQSINPPGPSQTLALNLPGFGEGDIPSSALLITVPGLGVKNIRRVALRGMYDSGITEGEYTPGPVFQQQLTAFFANLAGFQFQGRDFSQPTHPILSITGAGLVTCTEVIVGFPIGSFIRVLKTRDSSGNLRGGKFVITAGGPGANQGTIGGWNFGSTTGGSFRLDPGPIYPAVDAANIKPARIVTRKVGRPFTGFRGRRSRRR